jgi:hypothetical protein
MGRRQCSTMITRKTQGTQRNNLRKREVTDYLFCYSIIIESSTITRAGPALRQEFPNCRRQYVVIFPLPNEGNVNFIIGLNFFLCAHCATFVYRLRRAFVELLNTPWTPLRLER